MAWIAEFLVYTFARPILQVVLRLFGYNLDWDPTDSPQSKGWRLAISAIFCCAVSGFVLGGLVWLLWLLSR